MKSRFIVNIVFSTLNSVAIFAFTNNSYVKHKMCTIDKQYKVNTKLECNEEKYYHEKIIYENKTLYGQTNVDSNTIFNKRKIQKEIKLKLKANNINVTENDVIKSNISHNKNTHLSTTDSSLHKDYSENLSRESSEPMYKEYTMQELKGMAKEDMHEPEYIEEEPPLNSTEKIVMKMVLAKAEDLVEYLLDFGENLFDIFKKVPTKGGDLLIQDFSLYNTKLKELLNMAKTNKRYTYDAISDYLETNQPYPYVPKTEFCQEKIKQDFNWSNVDYDIFDNIYNTTTHLYCELQEFHNSLPDDDDDEDFYDSDN